MAILGLLISIFSIVAPLYASHLLEIKRIHIFHEIDTATILVTHIREEQSDLKEKIHAFKGGDSTVLQKEFNEIVEKTLKAALSGSEIRYLGQLDEYYQNKIDELNYYRYFASLFGLVLSLFGFYFWYVRLQRPSELVLASQVAETGIS
jgi:hypothetical protein